MGKFFYMYVAAIILAFIAGQSDFGFVFGELASKLPILFSVLLAAVFVRLARGMPTIPHEKIPAAKAKIATRAFRHLISAYVQTFAVFLLAIFLNLSLSSVEQSIILQIPYKIPYTLLAIIDFLSLSSLFYMVSADVKLAKVQADLIEEVVSQGEKASASAAVDNVAAAFSKSRQSPAITHLEDDAK